MSKKLDKITPISDAQLTESRRRILALPIEDRLELELAFEIARRLFQGRFSISQTNSEYVLQQLLPQAKSRCLKVPQEEREAEIKICAGEILAKIIPDEKTSSNPYFKRFETVDVHSATSDPALVAQLENFLQLCLLAKTKAPFSHPTVGAIAAIVEMKKASLDDPTFDSSIVVVRKKPEDYRKIPISPQCWQKILRKPAPQNLKDLT
jgi:hypothetical protein